MIKISLSGPLRPKESNTGTFETDAKTVNAALLHIVGLYPSIIKKLFKDGALNRFINIYVNEEDIRFREGLETPLNDGDMINIISAIAGG